LTHLIKGIQCNHRVLLGPIACRIKFRWSSEP